MTFVTDYISRRSSSNVRNLMNDISTRCIVVVRGARRLVYRGNLHSGSVDFSMASRQAMRDRPAEGGVALNRLSMTPTLLTSAHQHEYIAYTTNLSLEIVHIRHLFSFESPHETPGEVCHMSRASRQSIHPHPYPITN